MRDLIKRLQEAEAGSGELDYLVEQATSDWTNRGGGWRQHKVTGIEERYFGTTAPVTTSLDAIVALIGEKLPGWDWEATGRGWAMVDRPDSLKHEYQATAKTATLALCIALLTALQEQGEKA